MKGSTIYELELNSHLNCYSNSPETAEGWKKLDVNYFNIELPKETLLLAEKCVEYKGEVNLSMNTNFDSNNKCYFKQRAWHSSIPKRYTSSMPTLLKAKT